MHIVQREGFGRVLELTEDVAAGTAIILEKPAILCSSRSLLNPLRDFSQLNDDQRLWLNTLESHQWEKYPLPPCLHHADPEVIRFYRILQVNGHSFDRGKQVALFAHISLLEHSCASNAFYNSMPCRGVGAVMASRDLRKGSRITICYSPKQSALLFWPRRIREAEMIGGRIWWHSKGERQSSS